MLKGIVSGVEKNIVRIPMLVGNEYREGWEVRDNQDRLIWGREDEFQTITGTLPFKGYGLPVKVKSLLGNGSQSGTPSPDNIIMPTFCGVRTGNLAPPLTEWVDGYLSYTGNIAPQSSVNLEKTSKYIAITAGTAYSFLHESGSFPSTETANAWKAFGWYTSSGVFISRGTQATGGPFIQTAPENAAFCRVSFRTFGNTGNVMLNIGSTALPYEPYGYKTPLTCAGQTTPVYLGEVPTVRKVKKLVLDGTERYIKDSAGEYLYYIYATHLYHTNCLCSHLASTTGYPVSQEGCSSYNNVSIIYFNFGSSVMNAQASGNTTAGLKEYLASEYAAGHPVTVWYVLATPETGITNEPLAKIGTYADELSSTDAGVTIPTAKGQNTLTIDTDLVPSSLIIKGHIKEPQPENLLPVSKFEDLSDPSWWSGGYYIRYNNMPAGTYVMSTNMPEKDPGDVYFNGENALNVPYEGRPVSQTINEGDSFYVLFFIDRGGYEKILDGTFVITLVKSE